MGAGPHCKSQHNYTCNFVSLSHKNLPGSRGLLCVKSSKPLDNLRLKLYSSRRDWTWLDTVCGHGSASSPLARTIVSGLGCLLDKVEQCQGTKSTKFLLPVDKQTINSNVVTHSVTRQKIHTFKGEKINKSKCKNIFTTDNWRKTPWKWIIVSAVLMLIINLNCKY